MEKGSWVNVVVMSLHITTSDLCCESVSKSRTYTVRCCCVPLCEGTWHGLTADGTGSFQQVAWTALEADHRAGRELWTDPSAVARLWHRAALAVTGAGHSYEKWAQLGGVTRRSRQRLECSCCLHICVRLTQCRQESWSYLGRQSEILWPTGHFWRWTSA